MSADGLSNKNGIVEDRSKTEGEIKKAEQYEAFKQALLRLLDDSGFSKRSFPYCYTDSEQI
jgi:hypothetical protein